MQTTEGNKSYFWDFVTMVVVLGCVANFILFVAMNLYLGGDGLNGKVEDGHYFLGSHGHYTEVSAGIFTYSKIHAIVTFLWFGAMFLYAVVSNFREGRTKK